MSATAEAAAEGPGAFRPSAAEEAVAVLANEVVNGEYRHLVVSCSELAATAAPGQFYQLLCPAPPGTPAGAAPFLRRPMSLYGADPARRRVEFLYKVTGLGTRGLATLAPGDTMQLLGPLGRGYRLDPAWKHIVAVGRGAGLATLGPMAQAARRAGIGVTAILSARRPDLVVSDALFRAHGATVLTVTDAEGSSGPANVERLLRGLIAEGRCDAFFTCGSARLLRVQQLLAREFGLPGQVAMEQQMACGLGLCFCCVRDFNLGGEIVHRRVCWDGPVFDLLEALP
ncbi:dihydroorotate dehydrogenase electron transfer subunit [Roseomonas sp. NAR14]|uniref:Dihydroorotate dehydrogenase electron transfer subunit n=1 Tax=Roseomonas acroporae TaxID=2937791 RepID=A0A9X1YC51_9PROT|nr:dihydroorotate dehydrogenase electron transfer subunit [Roseomonas acroporae]MCK8785987.1 dihydroorotate dehydrogenase electron transfer subunit [Roseomonas acroporae]